MDQKEIDDLFRKLGLPLSTPNFLNSCEGMLDPEKKKTSPIRIVVSDRTSLPEKR